MEELFRWFFNNKARYFNSFVEIAKGLTVMFYFQGTYQDNNIPC